MPTVEELYGIWSRDSELRDALGDSLDPRGTDWLFELFASLGPQPGDALADIGCRDAKHAIRIVREHGLRGYAIDPVPLHVAQSQAEVEREGVDVSVLQGAIESLPLEDESVDWIWSRDMLVHTDVRRGLAECARVLRGGGRMVAYVTLPTELLEPRERELLIRTTALNADAFDRANVEEAARAANFDEVAVHQLAGEWREWMIESGKWDGSDSLLLLSRLQRREDVFVETYGTAAVEAVRGGHLWGIYQMIGKLCPTVYVWQRRA